MNRTINFVKDQNSFFKKYFALSSLFGLFTIGINTYNTPFKEISAQKEDKTRLYLKYGMTIGLKGLSYSFFAPIPQIGMLLSINNPKEFNKHIIPCTVHFVDDFETNVLGRKVTEKN